MLYGGGRNLSIFAVDTAAEKRNVPYYARLIPVTVDKLFSLLLGDKCVMYER
jgi:hypothetical protein